MGPNIDRKWPCDNEPRRGLIVCISRARFSWLSWCACRAWQWCSTWLRLIRCGFAFHGPTLHAAITYRLDEFLYLLPCFYTGHFQKTHFILKECENRITPLAAGVSPIIVPALPKRLIARSLHEVLFSGRILSGWSPVIKYVTYIMSNPPVRVCDDKGQNRSTNVSCCCQVHPHFISVAVTEHLRLSLIINGDFTSLFWKLGSSLLWWWETFLCTSQWGNEMKEDGEKRLHWGRGTKLCVSINVVTKVEPWSPSQIWGF